MYYSRLWGDYGPADSFDSAGRFSSRYNGINVTVAACMLENYRSRLIWDNFMSYEGVQRASSIIFPNSERPVIEHPSDWIIYAGAYKKDNLIQAKALVNPLKIRVSSLDMIGGNSDFIVKADSYLMFQVESSDDDGELSYYVRNLPEGANMNSKTFLWMPTQEQVGSYDVEIRVSDGNARWSSRLIRIQVISQEQK